MMMKDTLSIVFSLIMGLILTAQTQDIAREQGLAAITEEACQGQLEFLASDWTEGRATAERGNFIAADYIASMFMVYGIEPAGDIAWRYPTAQERIEGQRAEKYHSYFQDFQLIRSDPFKDQKLTITNGSDIITFNYKTDFSVESTTVGREIESEVVFVGYGFVDEEEGYDDFRGVDVKGKIILRLYGFPGHRDTASSGYRKFNPRGRYGWYYMRRDKNETALKKGAVGVISWSVEGDDPNSEWATNLPLRVNREYYEGDEPLPTIYDYGLSLPGDTLDIDPVNITLSARAMNVLLEGTGTDPFLYEERVAETLKPESKILKNKKIHLQLGSDTEMVTARNVLGMIPGKDTTKLIVAGAHFDHLGMRNGYIWNGADDNASGAVGVMMLAKAFAEAGVKPERTVVFAAWTGEEKGLLGSRYYSDHTMPEGAEVVMNLNFDMISRDSHDDTLGVECSMGYLKGYKYLEDLAKKNNEEHDLGLEINFWESSGRGGGSDHASFSRKGIPFFYFMAGWHADYHRPTDHAEKANIDKMARIIRLSFLNLWDIAFGEQLLPEAESGDDREGEE